MMRQAGALVLPHARPVQNILRENSGELMSRVRIAKPLVGLAIIVLAHTLLAARQPAPRGTSDPYAGDLSIFESADRAEKLQVERVMDVLGLKPGTDVADIGAGSGWFSVRAARRVAKDGTVYAVEINRRYVRHIKRRAAREKLPNIRAILGKADDPLLPPHSVDAVLLLKTYHEVNKPVPLLRKLRDAMRPGARLGIIDKNGIGTDHGLDADVVIKEAQQAGLTLVEQHDFVKSEGVDYFLVFEARQ